MVRFSLINTRRKLQTIGAIVFVCVVVYLFTRKHKSKRVPTTDSFQHALNASEMAALLRILEKFDNLMTLNNITYVLEGGTLIGSLRHHGPIPWDDDIDVFVNSRDKGRLNDLLPQMLPNFNFFATVNHAWKFYNINSPYLPFKRFRWPYVDIFFWRENGTHLYHEASKYRDSFTLPKHKVLPPVRRKFSSLSLPVPCNLEIAMKSINVTECVSSRYSHKNEEYIPSTKWEIVECSKLKDRFSFVHRQELQDGRWNETLVNRGRPVHTIITPEYC